MGDKLPLLERKDKDDVWWAKALGEADIISSRFVHSKTAATRPLPIERALKTDLVYILAAYQLQYSEVYELERTIK